ILRAVGDVRQFRGRVPAKSSRLVGGLPPFVSPTVWGTPGGIEPVTEPVAVGAGLLSIGRDAGVRAHAGRKCGRVIDRTFVDRVVRQRGLAPDVIGGRSRTVGGACENRDYRLSIGLVEIPSVDVASVDALVDLIVERFLFQIRHQTTKRATTF